ncbi:MAG: ABC transporter substrate-binding protein [Pararhodobacter sp.]
MRLTRRILFGAVASVMALGTMAGAPQAEPRQGGELVIISTQAPRHLNPAVQSGIATGVPGTQIFASLLRYDGDWNPQPHLAESWEWADDGLSLTVRLVQNAVFHDGAPITSSDVAFSIRTIQENHPFQTMFAPVEDIETPDEHTAIFRLSQPHPALLLALSSALSPIIPEHVYGDGQDVANHPANSAPVGSGPFRLAEFRPGEQITLERFDDFFIDGRPYLDRIIIRIVRDPSTMVLAMEAGEADMLPYFAESQGIRRLQGVSALDYTTRGYEGIGAINWLAFNTRSAPLDDVRVRQAIAFAVDRDFIIRALHRGTSTPQRGPIIESSPFFNPEIEPYDLDLDRANALLDEAGHPAGADGTRFSLTIDFIPGNAEQQQNVAEYIRSQLRRVGIAVDVRAAPDFPTWAGRVAQGEFDMTMDFVFNWGDPVIGVHRTYLSTNIRPVIWSNTQGYANDQVDAILAEAAQEPDIERRTALYAEFQQIIADEVPIYFLNAVPYYTFHDARLANVPVSIWGPMQAMDEVYWTEDR